MRSFFTAGVVLSTASAALAQSLDTMVPSVRQYVSIDRPTFALRHVQLIDGTGGPPKSDQTIVVALGKIAWVGPSSRDQVPADALVLDLSGHTVTPGLVGLHNHTSTTPRRPGQPSPTTPRPDSISVPA